MYTLYCLIINCIAAYHIAVSVLVNMCCMYSHSPEGRAHIQKSAVHIATSLQ